jgi:hypothetical protein
MMSARDPPTSEGIEMPARESASARAQQASKSSIRMCWVAARDAGAHGDGNVVLDLRLLSFVRPCETDRWPAALCFKIDFVDYGV